MMPAVDHVTCQVHVGNGLVSSSSKARLFISERPAAVKRSSRTLEISPQIRLTMPPKTLSKDDKVKAVKGDEAEEIVLEYMKKINRPYAVADVTANLKGKVTKLNVQKILGILADKGSLTVKAYGKQNIYVYNQALLPPAPPGALEELEQRSKQARIGCEDDKKTLKGLLAELEALQASPATKDLRAEISKLQAENEATIQQLHPLREMALNGGSDTTFTPEEAAKLDAEWLKWRKEWVDRRKIYNSLISDFLECSLIVQRSEFEDAQGIEIDRSAEIEIEESELCKPPVIIKRSSTKRSSATHGRLGGNKKI